MAKKKILNITSAISEKYKMPLKDAEAFVTMMFDVVNEALLKEKLVKVKGLGTFKVATVKDRESVNVNTGERVLIEGHDKITFTPDAALRDFVNKPFAQFETMVVKEGVDFSDLDASETPDSPEIQESSDTPDALLSPVMGTTETPEKTETPSAAGALKETTSAVEAPEETAKSAAAVKQETTTEQQHVIDEQLTTLKKKVAALESLSDEVARLQEEVDVLRKRNRRNLILACLLAVIAFVAGFFVGRGTLGQMDKPADAPETKVEAPADTVGTASTATTQPAAKQETPAADSFEAYNSDPRIKYGAYDIVGIDTVITLRPGQTLQSVCRATLGADMMSYMEVVNDAKSLETGKVKVPKLKMRKLKK